MTIHGHSRIGAMRRQHRLHRVARDLHGRRVEAVLWKLRRMPGRDQHRIPRAQGQAQTFGDLQRRLGVRGRPAGLQMPQVARGDVCLAATSSCVIRRRRRHVRSRSPAVSLANTDSLSMISRLVRDRRLTSSVGCSRRL